MGDKMRTVLHIASHMGGGVGKVLSNVALARNTEYNHHILLLEKPIDTVFTDKLDELTLTVEPSVGLIIELIGESDLVSWEYWNHPLLAGVMHDVQNIPMRSIVWSHTAGCYYPFIKEDFVTMPHHFIFSSEYSRENPYYQAKMFYSSVINSSGGFASTRDVPLQKHDGFNIGYVGTLGYVKLNPQFMDYCESVSTIPGVKFIMIGRIPEPNLVLRDAKERGIDHLFEFKGWVQDLPAELSKLDVLGYLLNPYHFGTTENAMLEAMSMGIPAVVLDQCAEKYLVNQNDTGYRVKNKTEYESAIRYLYENPATRYRIGQNGRNHVLQTLELSNTTHKLNAVYDLVLRKDKRRLGFDKVFGKTPYDWYQAGLPPGGLQKISSHLSDSTKGSVKQWAKYYPNDEKLAVLVKG
jgi:glycosyltransferase involved in cell wall biosynthesis